MLGPKGTAPVRPGISIDGMNHLNRLIELKVMERIGSDLVRFTDEFNNQLNEINRETINKKFGWLNDNPLTWSRSDRIVVLLECMKITISEYLSKRGENIDDKELSDLCNSADQWSGHILIADIFREHEMKEFRKKWK